MCTKLKSYMCHFEQTSLLRTYYVLQVMAFSLLWFSLFILLEPVQPRMKCLVFGGRKVRI